MSDFSWQGRSVLIVDDEEDFARTLASRLELRGFEARCAFCGEQGLERLADALPDILLLDMRMPDLSGVDVLRRLRVERAIPGGESLPIIIISGHCSEEDSEQADKLGIQGYFAKPLDMEALLAGMQDALEGREHLHV